jgi:hypothetical protein
VKAWYKSCTLWAAVIGIVLCYTPYVREFLRQADLALLAGTHFFYLLLRFKTTEALVFKDNTLKEPRSFPS